MFLWKLHDTSDNTLYHVFLLYVIIGSALGFLKVCSICFASM